MNKKTKLIALGFLATVGATFTISSAFAKNPDQNLTRLEALTKLTKIIQTVENYYVDDISIDEIINKSIDGLLSNLDAHSSFLNDKKYQELKIQTDGEFGGLGITVGMKDVALTVIAPIEGTPADKAGLKAGDIILKIEDTSTLNMTIDEAVNLMRGKPKTKIKLTIVRKNESKPLEFVIVRDIIKVQSVYSKTINDDILYIRVTSFDRNVASAVREAITKNRTPTKGIILDLRNNPGGLLDQAVELTDIFVSDGVIVSQKGRVESENIEYKATSEGTIKDIPLVVLVNSGSASASEIVSGALQDKKRAIVVGEKTFGKGSVQVILPVNQTEALRLTIARYYLPSGRTIQASGLEPDVVVYPGEVPREVNEFKIKESELKMHLESELGKIEEKKVEEKKEKKDENKNIITEDDVFKDIQLKSAIDILKSMMILNSRS